MRFFINLCLGLALCLIAACGGSKNSDQQTGGGQPGGEPPITGSGLPIPDNRYVDEYRILLVGNSHVTANNLSAVIKLMLEEGTGKTVLVEIGPGWAYLDDRINDGVTRAYVLSNNWSHIIWQAQKYSTTGQYFYPTDASEYWVALTKQHDATPIMFPEHPRQGNYEEGMRVYMLHREIANREPTCVSPVGPAWDSAVAAMPEVDLHADGNHAAIAGTFLTAALFYQTISGEVAEDLPYLPEIDVSEQRQTALKQIVTATLQQYTDCSY